MTITNNILYLYECEQLIIMIRTLLQLLHLSGCLNFSNASLLYFHIEHEGLNCSKFFGLLNTNFVSFCLLNNDFLKKNLMVPLQIWLTTEKLLKKFTINYSLLQSPAWERVSVLFYRMLNIVDSRYAFVELCYITLLWWWGGHTLQHFIITHKSTL